MTKRASVFESDDPADLDLSAFQPKPPPVDAVPAEQVRAIAEASNFPSREAKKERAVLPPAPAVKVVPAKGPARRQYRTGRSAQINVRASAETVADFYAIVDGEVDGKRRSAADTMEQAVAALKRELAGAAR